jgi:hypothetical protein
VLEVKRCVGGRRRVWCWVFSEVPGRLNTASKSGSDKGFEGSLGRPYTYVRGPWRAIQAGNVSVAMLRGCDRVATCRPPTAC